MHAAGPDPWPGGCECGGGDTMNALAANDFEAADLLALARLERLRRQEPLPGPGQPGAVRHRRGDGWSAALSG